jgi:hypothetical protein
LPVKPCECSERHPHIGELTERRAAEHRWRNAGHRRGLAVDEHWLADNVRTAIETGPPELFADDHDECGIVEQILAFREPATTQESDAEELEVIARH